MELAARIGTMARRGAPLPYDAEVEYIESSGTQFIDTGIKHVSETYEFYCDFTPLEDENRNIVFGGSKNGRWDGNSWDDYLYIGSGNVILGFHRRSGVRKRLKLIVGNNTVAQYDGETFIGSKNFQGSVISGFNILLFAYTYGSSSPTGLSKQQVHEFSFREDGSLIFDYVPVRFTNENGVSEGAMYDRVSGQLFRNAGTGAFIVGPDVVSTRGGGT